MQRRHAWRYRSDATHGVVTAWRRYRVVRPRMALSQRRHAWRRYHVVRARMALSQRRHAWRRYRVASLPRGAPRMASS